MSLMACSVWLPLLDIGRTEKYLSHCCAACFPNSSMFSIENYTSQHASAILFHNNCTSKIKREIRKSDLHCETK